MSRKRYPTPAAARAGAALATLPAASEEDRVSADGDLRAVMATLPVPELEGHPFTTPVPLAEAQVAIVTTAGLHAPDDEAFGIFDPGFRVLPHESDAVTISHNSQNLDRSGMMLDRNVVFPTDRLDELAEAGTIGSVAPNHVSFMGAQADLATILADSGPRAAHLLREQGTDIALLTPV
jgi:D-proline reductase (dithiol) PrdB